MEAIEVSLHDIAVEVIMHHQHLSMSALVLG